MSKSCAIQYWGYLFYFVCNLGRAFLFSLLCISLLSIALFYISHSCISYVCGVHQSSMSINFLLWCGPLWYIFPWKCWLCLPSNSNVIYITVFILLCICFARRCFGCCSLFETMQTLYFAVYGLINVSHFELNQGHDFTQFVGKLIYGSYCAIMVVVLLNMLIAMLSNSYQNISVSASRQVCSSYSRAPMFPMCMTCLNTQLFLLQLFML